jgi:hypothetical protein
LPQQSSSAQRADSFRLPVFVFNLSHDGTYGLRQFGNGILKALWLLLLLAISVNTRGRFPIVPQ